MPSSAAQKRAQREARFAAKQASLPQIERLENRADLEERSQKTYAFSTAYQHRLSKAWFLEFVQLTSPNDFDPNYFEKEGPLPTPGLIKRYAVYLSQSRVGRINDKISAPSILHMIKQLLTQFERHRRRDFVKADRTDIYNYIRHDLVKQEGLTTLMKPKPICLSEDTTYIMSVLYSPAYLATFSHMRNVLNITLYINLMIDSAGRGGDILHTRASNGHVEFAWKHVEFYAFGMADGVDIKAKLRFCYLKGMKLDESKYKEVVVSMLSTKHAAEDSLRLLLLLALMDGVFANGITTWEDLMRLRPSETGELIQLRPSMLEVPVLRKVSLSNNLVSDVPETLDQVQKEIRRLGVACGFQSRMSGYAWRRGVAYLLDAQTSAGARRYLMGHKSNSEIYSAYMSKTSPVDLQGIFRNLEQQNLQPMMCISLNKRQDAPKKISTAEHEAALMDSGYQALVAEVMALHEALCQEYGSLVASSRAADPRFDDFRRLTYKQYSLKATLIRKRFGEEYDAFFKTTTCLVAPPPPSIAMKGLREHEEEGDSSQSLFVVPQRDLATSSASSPRSLSSLPASESRPSIPTACLDADEDEIQIDPALLAEGEPTSSFEASIEEMRLQMEGEEEGEMEEEKTLGAEEERPSGEEGGGEGASTAIEGLDVQPNSTTRLHGLPGKPGFYVYNTRGSRYHFGSGVCMNMNGLFNSGQDEAELASRLIECFLTTHAIDAFYPGEEPFPGTYCCRFCNISLTRTKSPAAADEDHPSSHVHRHVHACAKAAALAWAQSDLEQRVDYKRPCSYQYIADENSTRASRSCGNVATSVQGAYNHLQNHMLHMETAVAGSHQKGYHCSFQHCAGDHSPSLPQSIGELKAHLLQVHGIWYKRTLTAEVEFCQYCETWLSGSEDPKAHLELHAIDALDLIKATGYVGFTAGRSLRPDLCVFCYHDHTLTLRERIYPIAHVGYTQHIAVHLRRIGDDDALRCPAYPEMCRCDALLSKIELKEHLQKIHRIPMPKTEERKPKQKRKRDRQQSPTLADEETQPIMCKRRGCDPSMAFETQKELKHHTEAVHSAYTPTACHVPSCDSKRKRVFKSLGGYVQHLKRVHDLVEDDDRAQYY